MCWHPMALMRPRVEAVVVRWPGTTGQPGGRGTHTPEHLAATRLRHTHTHTHTHTCIHMLKYISLSTIYIYIYIYIYKLDVCVCERELVLLLTAIQSEQSFLAVECI